LLKQVNIIESLRAIAAWSVCLFHFVNTTIGFVSNETVLSIFKHGQQGVYVFFVISGFIIPWSMYSNNYKLSSFFKYILKRIVRLDPPYIASIILVILLIFIKPYFGYNDPATVSFKQVALHLGYLINFFPEYHWLNNVYWTLAIEFQYYIAMALCFVLFVNQNSLYRMIGYVLFFGIALIDFHNKGYHFPFHAPLFMLGIVTFLFMKQIIKNLEMILVFTASLFLVCYNEGAEIMIIGGATALIILFFDKVRIPGLHEMGKFSYSVYLIHPVTGITLVNILSHHVNGPLQKILVVIGGVVITFISSYLMYLLIEKPSKNWASKIKL
jgi:peptidoglycan/LPS O-acetylase OafA/YrhL